MLGIMIIKEGFMHVQIIFRSNVTGASLKPLKSFCPNVITFDIITAFKMGSESE